MAPVMIMRCDLHPGRPDRDQRTLEVRCDRCKDAIAINSRNPGWEEAGYLPVFSWDQPDAFTRARPR